MENLRAKLAVAAEKLESVNRYLLAEDNPILERLVGVVERWGGPEAINQQAAEAGRLDNLLRRVAVEGPEYRRQLDWLIDQRERRAFVPLADWRAAVLGDAAATTTINEHNAVTLEISALQFFPWLIDQAQQAIAKRELMPGRFIRVRNMAEQSQDHGDTPAVAAAMRIVGASWVETLDTKGTDGSNVHLGGPDTITGYFGGVGMPNDYPIKWVEEFLRYYTTYGVKQVLNVNPGSVFAAYMLHRLGVNVEFKISVYMGNDNPFAVLWTLMAAKLFSRDDGTTPLIGFNFSNSVNAETIRQAAHIRRALGLEDKVRFEHHITETYKAIVRQPYLRRDELVEVAAEVPNISAKHEGGDPEVELTREHPSNILEYFMAKTDIEAQGLMPLLLRNYLDKHDALNRTAEALTRAGVGVIAARELHG